MDSEIITSEVLRSLAADQSRVDKRTIRDARPNVVVETNLVANALGSAMVAHGSTLVACAITAELSPVLPDRPNRGYSEVAVLYNPATCYAITPSEQATLQPTLPDDRDALWQSEASCILQKAFDLSRCVDLESLVIAEGEACWVMRIQCVVMQDDGGVLDACSAAIKRALEVAKPPTEVVLPDGSRQPWSPPTSSSSSAGEKEKNIFLAGGGAPARLVSVGYLFVKNGSHVYPSEADEVVVIVDPTAAEAVVVDGCVTVAVSPAPSSSSYPPSRAGGKKGKNSADAAEEGEARRSSKLLSLNCHGGKPATSAVIDTIVKFVLENII